MRRAAERVCRTHSRCPLARWLHTPRRPGAQVPQATRAGLCDGLWYESELPWRRTLRVIGSLAAVARCSNRCHWRSLMCWICGRSGVQQARSVGEDRMHATAIKRAAPAVHRGATSRGLADLHARASAVVERHYRRHLTLQVLARALATSPRQLQRAYAEIRDASSPPSCAPRGGATSRSCWPTSRSRSPTSPGQPLRRSAALD